MSGSLRPGIGHFIILISIAVFFRNIGSAELHLPENLFFYNSVASVWGQPAIWTNPAAISPRQSGHAVIFTHRDGRVVQDWAITSSFKTFGSAYRHIDYEFQPDLDEWLLAMGGGQRLCFGLSYRYIKNGPEYLNKRHLWSIGLLSRHRRDFSIGIRIENLNRGRINGERSEVRYIWGVANRYLGDKITFSFDVDMTSNESLKDADFHTGIEVRPVPGLYLYGNFDNHSRFFAGFRVNIGSSFAGHYHAFDRNGKSTLGTSYIGSSRGNQPSLIKLKPKKLYLKLDGELPENPAIPRFQKRPLRFFDYVGGIYHAADDGTIDGLFIDIGALSCGMARVEELTEAIRYFRSKNKKVTIYLSDPTNLGYLLACIADKIIIPPVSQLSLVGLRAELRTYKGLMDKIGLEAEIERVDKYKTAPEQWLFEEPSQPYREEINRLLDNLYQELVTNVAINRKLAIDSVKVLIDRAPLTSVEAVSAGLVDERKYLDEAKQIYIPPASPIGGGAIALYDYLNNPKFTDQWGGPEQIALIIADGDITGSGHNAKIGGHKIEDAIRKARNNHDVKGIILRINSPGGSALAADHIWHELEKTAQVKPMVISMGNIAASGGYYISTIPNHIYANRSTITGSIGVYAGKINLSEFFDKVGIYSETYHRGQNAGMLSFSEPFTDKQKQHLRSQLEKFYDHFVTKVAEARLLSVDTVMELGQGKTWTGQEAVQYGLADRLGGIYPALKDLQHELGLESDYVEVISYPRKYYLFQNPFDLSQLWDRLYRWISVDEPSFLVGQQNETDFIYFRIPYNIEIK